MELDLGLVRTFVEVADTEHFGRAAGRLHLAQSAVSRRIQRLESQLGVALLERTSRSVVVTDAGKTFLADARALLVAAEAARRRLTAHQRLEVAFVPGVSPSPVVAALRADGHEPDIGMRRVQWYEQGDVLRTGAADVLLGRLPIVGEGLRVEPLWTESRMVLLPTSHRLARRSTVQLAELADEPMVRHDGPVAVSWDAEHNIDPRPDGKPVPTGPIVRTLEEKLEYVATGVALTILPSSVSTLFERDDLVVVPVVDAPPATVALAWNDDRQRLPARDAFLAAARAMGR
ncbi:LysR family transcriptional regulator [Euzebya rosea]|uniref:LysR family transcriptional regulator n=1 Tax=Euzebya rosea TaxID=2052804 RepID=UPI001475D60E|nr:LysR family transcriptional regulator [Euzebya rosea]